MVDKPLLFRKIAEFRNVVVHQYEQVDAEVVMRILSQHLGDFERFKAAILAHLNALRDGA